MAKVMGTLEGSVAAFHEPVPDFAHVMRAAQHFYPLFYHFWIDRKLPHIHRVAAHTYIETSHLFVEGFALPLLRLGVVPDIIVLRRPQREVALSMWRCGSVPARNYMGQRYLLQPNDDIMAPVVRHPRHWHFMTDYQLCYWFTIEIERRIQQYVPKFKQAGSQVIEATLDDITDEERFRMMVSMLSLRQPHDAAYAEHKDIKYNARDDKRVPDEDLDESEQFVNDIVGHRHDVKWADDVYGGWWSD